MDLFSWIALIGGITGVSTLTLSIARYVREKRNDPRAGFAVASEPTRLGLAVQLRWNMHDEIKALQFRIYEDFKPLTELVHPVDISAGATIVTVAAKEPARVWVFISYLDPSRPGQLTDLWAPVADKGVLLEELDRQLSRAPLSTWFLKHVLGYPASPRGIPRRRQGWREKRERRKELRAEAIEPYPPGKRPSIGWQGIRE